MSMKLLLSPNICRALAVAFLLTGDIVSAENALLQSIELLPSDVVDSGELTLCAVRLIVGTVACRQYTMGGWPDLPTELQSVLKLKPVLRLCFVLRILLRLSSHESAELSQLDEGLMTAHVHEAMRQLADGTMAASNSFSIIDRSLQKCAP